MVQLLGLQGLWRHHVHREADSYGCKRYGFNRDFSSLCSRHSKGCPGWSFFIAWPSRHLLDSPSWSFSIPQCNRHSKGSSSCSFCIDQLLMLACGEREATVVAPPPLCDSAVTPCFWWPPGFSPKAFLVWISSLHPLSCLPVINRSLSSEIALQSPFSSCQQPCTPVDPHPNSGYVGPRHWLSMCFSFPSDSHRSAALPSNILNSFPLS